MPSRLQNQSKHSFKQVRDINVEDFALICQQSTQPDAYPFASDIIHNIPIYQGRELAQLCEDKGTFMRAKEELLAVLKDGPGVLVIKSAYVQSDVVDRMTRLFEQILEEERAFSLGGDHFAKAGKNSRIWNAFEKTAYKQADTFMHYYKNPIIQMVSEAWLGPHYQITSQMNTVHPGGEAQSPHRDYHLGFQSVEEVSRFPLHLHENSSYLTLQGAIAHTDMPLDTGPTQVLPFSQGYALGYLAWRDKAFQAYFEQHKVQLPLEKGDAIFFSPALFHAAGANRTQDKNRVANLLQISACFAKPMETLDQYVISQALYPTLLAHWPKALTPIEKQAIMNAVCEGYAFPTNLDKDAPIGGLAPKSHAQMTYQALDEAMPYDEYLVQVTAHKNRRLSI